ncbi:sulfite exporter TauE/SafE family protein [Pyrococcus kukulkanii]|uniref:sulfite exporter TauE/SafE family protein n=1 Tax=Pyrococcus kukulkanii TaxID=1609559 RepID=UPI000F2BCE72|nr:MAG: sulfite exporter TauE/SafE family protein [Thermococci archaeon]
MLEFAVLGLGIGFLAGLLGVGGGFLIVPTLVILGKPIHLAIGTSLACITVSSFSSAVTHLRRDSVLPKVVLLKEVFSVPSAILGSYASSLLPEKALRIAFGILLLYLSYTLLKKREEGDENPNINYRAIPIIGIISGTMSGLLGISGGVLNVPLFHSLAGIPMRYAIGTSSLALFFTALAGSIGHYRLGHVDPRIILTLAPGLIVGGYLGATTAHKTHPEILKKIFAMFLVIMALRMIL